MIGMNNRRVDEWFLHRKNQTNYGDEVGFDKWLEITKQTCHSITQYMIYPRIIGD